MNAREEKESTKKRIMTTAVQLFAESGFAATSVRDIATAAEVNVASINYHFGNKAGLFEKILEHSYEVLNEEVERLGKKNPKDTEALVLDIYAMFQEHAESLVNTFKVFLAQPAELADVEEEVRMDGPPGHAALEACIQRELGGKIPQNDLIWASKVLFTQLIHIILVKSSHCSRRPHMQALLTDELLQKDLQRLTRCVLADLKANV